MTDAPIAWLPQGATALAFAIAVLVLNATPGVDLLLTVTRTLQRGPRAGLAAAAGISAGSVGHALAAAFGLTALLAVHPGAFRALQFAGAAYLAWLGLGLLRQALGSRPAVDADRVRGPAPESSPGSGPAGPARPASVAADFRTGLLTNLLNPKVALFFLAFLPAFVPAASPSKTAAFLLLGAWFVVQSFVFLAVVVALVAALGARGSLAWRRALQAAGGMIFLALAARLLSEGPAAPVAMEVSR